MDKCDRGRAYLSSTSHLSTSPLRPSPHELRPGHLYVMTCVRKLYEKLDVTVRGMKPLRGVGEQCQV